MQDFFWIEIHVLKIDSLETARIVGSVVEFSPATRETGVRFPDNALSFVSTNEIKIAKRSALRVGFEPTREDPIWFRVKRLNHSAIAAIKSVRNTEQQLAGFEHVETSSFALFIYCQVTHFRRLLSVNYDEI